MSITDCGMTLFFILCIKIHLFLFSRSLKGCQFSSFKTSLDRVSYVLVSCKIERGFCHLTEIYLAALQCQRLQSHEKRIHADYFSSVGGNYTNNRNQIN